MEAAAAVDTVAVRVEAVVVHMAEEMVRKVVEVVAVTSTNTNSSNS